MKIAIIVVMTLVLAVMYGCESNSERGGGTSKDVGFKIAVPTFGTEVKQGETKNFTVSLERGAYFKQDVKLQIKASNGISVEPTKVWVKASNNPDVQLQISAAKDAALRVLLHNARGPFQNLPRTAGWGYPEPYTRDLMISALGFLATGNEQLADALERTLVAQAPKLHDENVAACEEGYSCVDALLTGVAA